MIPPETPLNYSSPRADFSRITALGLDPAVSEASQTESETRVERAGLVLGSERHRDRPDAARNQTKARAGSRGTSAGAGAAEAEGNDEERAARITHQRLHSPVGPLFCRCRPVMCCIVKNHGDSAVHWRSRILKLHRNALRGQLRLRPPSKGSCRLESRGTLHLPPRTRLRPRMPMHACLHAGREHGFNEGHE